MEASGSSETLVLVPKEKLHDTTTSSVSYCGAVMTPWLPTFRKNIPLSSSRRYMYPEDEDNISLRSVGTCRSAPRHAPERRDVL
jgi:hypothetical protein